MAKFVSWIIMVPVALAVIAFSVSNRDPIVLNLWPLPYTVAAPLALVVLSVLAVGFLIGGAVAGFSAVRVRLGARLRDGAAARRAASLEGKIGALEGQLESLRQKQSEPPDRPSARPSAGQPPTGQPPTDMRRLASSLPPADAA